MSVSTTDRPAGRHLSLVPGPAADLHDSVLAAMQTADNLNRLMAGYVTRPQAPARLARVPLSVGAALDVERAEGFLYDLAAEFDREPTIARLSYLIGTAEAHLANLLGIVKSVTVPDEEV